MRIIVILVLQISIKSDGRLFVQTLLNNVFQIRESSSADKQNVSCIHSCQRNHCILAVCPYRHFHFTAFQKLQHSLLNRLAAYISLIGVFLFGDLVDFINKNNAMLCFFHIVICSCKKLGYHTFNIIANVACLCKGGSVCNSKRYIQKSCKCFYKISLTASCRSDHQHVGFFNFNFIHGVCCHTLIMIINCN